MKKRISILIFFSFLFSTLLCVWNYGEPHKMHFPQLGDYDGYCVDFGTWYLADDFQCAETGQITDIHFYFSVYPGNYPEILKVNIGIWSNLPAGELPYSTPNLLKWWRSFEFYQGEYGISWGDSGDLGWFDPLNNDWELSIQDDYGQISIQDIPDPFWQIAGTIYWLVIDIPDNQLNTHGWVTTYNHWEDNAVWGSPGDWNELFNPEPPYESLDFAFVITNDTQQLPVELSSFTAVYSNSCPTLFWTTQSESNNLGWNVYRSYSNDLEQSLQINNELIPGAGTTSEPTDYIYEDEYEVVIGNEYWYWIESVQTSGETITYGPISLLIPEDGEDPGTPDIPDIYGLHQNYPNPFNPNTKISYMMPEDCIGTLIIYDIKSQAVITLFKDKPLGKDEKLYTDWNSKDSNGNLVPSGVYIYKLITDRGDYSRKMVLTK
ncbi:MAG: T9SS type A sorting domain-containing protein [Candidatus Cloacimonetes bacterium]|nr:T9SS type A sorting domain-containing protein [Candidatus Cloacimonadota bacterium]